MRLSIRPEDRRNLTVGFVGLLVIMVAHIMMETARDALFLTSLPATQLPWAYLAIALLAIVELKIHEHVMRRVRDRRQLLSLTLLTGSLITVGFWAWIEDLGLWAPFGFYVWTGLLITIVLIQYWLLLDDAVTVTQAKRIFPAIAAGGVTGAMLGAFAAERLLRFFAPIDLVIVAAVVLAFASATPFLWRIGVGAPSAPNYDRETASVGWLLGDSYLSRILSVVLLGTITLTIVDYVFKSTVASQIPAEGLAPFFARFYLGLNSVALVIQIVGAGWLLRGFGAHRSSALLPAMLMGGALGLVLGNVMVFAIALKAFDGTLRHTLYRGAVEVLYLPLDSERRERAKGIIDVFGHRVGQALASVLIMALVGLGLTSRQFGLALFIPIALWLMSIFGTRQRYIEQFRSRLRQGAIDTTLELEALDLHSLETLLTALNSERDEEVLAAVEVFSTHGREDLVPVLVLYHPAKAVRIRALEAFSEAGDRRFVPIAHRMLNDDDPDVRAAALRALTAVDPDQALLEEKLDTEASIVRATALIGLLSINPTSKADQLVEWVKSGSARTRRSLAQAIRHEQGAVFHEALTELVQSDDIDVRLETLAAMAHNPDPRYLPHLLPLLGVSELREPARQAMEAIGSPALAYLDDALGHRATDRKVRRRIPNTIIRFDATEGAEILMRHLVSESDARVRLQIVRALGRLQSRHGPVHLDPQILGEQLRENLGRAVRLATWRVAVERHSTEGHESGVDDSELLGVALADKERACLERALSIVGLQHPSENFALVWRGLRSDDKGLRAASIEVIEATLSGATRDAVLALVDHGETPERRARLAALALGQPSSLLSYADAVLAMTKDSSEVIRSIAAHHAAALGVSPAPEPRIFPKGVPEIA
ncbi:MAG: Npt1/Npt2 family nucleotide transporter [Myxococcota bacterium]